MPFLKLLQCYKVETFEGHFFGFPAGKIYHRITFQLLPLYKTAYLGINPVIRSLIAPISIRKEKGTAGSSPVQRKISH
ncbi:MAG: hypothetical protein JWP78_52 [Mucilaginibacter sp.]|nr:hypothetical protein [Mucilaginibacter sp.]